jgi:hypothetical protein
MQREHYHFCKDWVDTNRQIVERSEDVVNHRDARKAKPAGRAKKAATPQRGSKTAKILALLKRPGGASLQQLQKATGWQAHSVRGPVSAAAAR